jgi:hypothetical protein
MKKKSGIVTVVQNEEAPVAKEVLAQAIIDISAAMKKLSAGKLNRRAIVVLVAHDTHQYQNSVERVLDSLEHLKQNYTN